MKRTGEVKKTKSHSAVTSILFFIYIFFFLSHFDLSVRIAFWLHFFILPSHRINILLIFEYFSTLD